MGDTDWGVDRGVSAAVSVGLMVGVALVLFGATAVFLFGFTDDIDDEQAVVKLDTEMEGDQFVVSHQGGDSLDPGEVVVRVEGTDSATELDVSEEIGSEEVFAAGDAVEIGRPSGGAAVVEVVHEPTNSILFEEEFGEPTETDDGSDILFYDDFDGSGVVNQTGIQSSGWQQHWERMQGTASVDLVEYDGHSALKHSSYVQYQPTGDVRTDRSFEPEGTMTFGTRLYVGEDYNGLGMSIEYEDSNDKFFVREHKWAGYNRFQFDSPDEPRETLSNPAVGPGFGWTRYVLTIDFDAGEIIRLKRISEDNPSESETYDLDNHDFQPPSADDEFRIRIGHSGMRTVYYDYVWAYDGDVSSDPTADG